MNKQNSDNIIIVMFTVTLLFLFSLVIGGNVLYDYDSNTVLATDVKVYNAVEQGRIDIHDGNKLIAGANTDKLKVKDVTFKIPKDKIGKVKVTNDCKDYYEFEVIKSS